MLTSWGWFPQELSTLCFLQEFLLSEEIYDTVLKEKKIDDVSDLYKEFAILGTKLKEEALARKYVKLHVSLFGFDHPRTLEIFKYLDDHHLPFH